MANLYNHPFAPTLKQSALQPAHTLVISGNAARLSSVPLDRTTIRLVII
jgi:hypothetical protein